MKEKATVSVDLLTMERKQLYSSDPDHNRMTLPSTSLEDCCTGHAHMQTPSMSPGKNHLKYIKSETGFPCFDQHISIAQIDSRVVL